MNRGLVLTIGLVMAFMIGAVLIGLMIPVLPLWFLGVAFLPVLFVVSLSAKMDQGAVRVLNILLCAYVLIFPIWPHYSALKIGGLPAINPQRVIYLFILIIWVFGLIASAYQQKLFAARLSVARSELVFLAIFLLWQFLSCFESTTTPYSLFIFFRDFVLNFIILFSVISFVRGVQDVNNIMRFIAIGTMVVAGIAIIEGVLQRNLIAGLLPVTTDYELWATAERVRAGNYRVQATFDNPLLLVDFLALAFPISVLFWRTARSLYASLVGFVAMIGIPLAMLLSGSRSAMVVIVVEVIIGIGLLALRPILNKTSSAAHYLVLVFLLFATIVSAISLPVALESLTGRNMEEYASTSARLTMVSRAIPLIEAEPIIGYGLTHGDEKVGVKLGNMYVLDNYFLTIGLDSGVPALLGYVGFMFLIIYRSISLSLSSNRDISMPSMAISISLIGFLVVKLISSQTQVFPLMFVLVGLLWVLSSSEGANNNTKSLRSI